MSEVENLVNKHLVALMQKERIGDVLRIAEKEGLSPWTYDAYEAEIDRDDSITLQAASLISNQLLGFIVMRLITKRSGDLPSTFDLLNIAVEDSFKKRGVGKDLLFAALQRASTHLPAEILLEVRRGNHPAITFYEKHGFSREGIRKNFYRLPDEDAIVMKLLVK